MANKKVVRSVIFIELLFFVIFLNLVFASAALDEVISGVVNNYSSDIHLKVVSDASNGEDVYDFSAADSPSDYAKFYSTSGGNNLAVDAWDGTPRTFNLTYYMASSQTGSITFNWYSLDGSDYDGTFTYYGDDSTYTTSLGSANMRDLQSYSTTISNEDTVYARVSLTQYIAPAGESTNAPTGGGALAEGFWIRTFNVDDTKLDEGFSKFMGERERYSFNVDGGEHHVGVIDIKEDGAYINISSRSLQVFFNIGDEKLFDLNENNFYDTYVKLNTISNAKASVSVKKIKENIKVSFTEPYYSINGETKTESPKANGNSLLFAIIMTVLISILVIGIIIILISHHRNQVKQASLKKYRKYSGKNADINKIQDSD